MGWRLRAEVLDCGGGCMDCIDRCWWGSVLLGMCWLLVVAGKFLDDVVGVAMFLGGRSVLVLVLVALGKMCYFDVIREKNTMNKLYINDKI